MTLSGWRSGRWLAGSSAAFVLVGMLVGGCDDEPVEDEGNTGRDVPEVVDGCPDDQADGVLVPIGETRMCGCDDGEDSTQVCLSSGEFGFCECAASGW